MVRKKCTKHFKMKLPKIDNNERLAFKLGYQVKGKVNPGKSFPVFFTLDRSSEMM